MKYTIHLLTALFLLSSCELVSDVFNLGSFIEKAEKSHSKNKDEHLITSPKEDSNKIELTVEHNLCLFGCPINNDSTIDIISDHNLLRLAIDKETKFANWVAYKVVADNINGPSRNRYWKADPNIDNKYAITPDDYKNAYATCGYDRGHLAPLASFSNNNNYKVVNYLSNIAPQKDSFNRGSWKRLEFAVRDLITVKGYNEVYVITGSYYDDNEVMCSLPNATKDTRVPNGYWKVVAQVKTGPNNIVEEINLAAFKFRQDAASNANYCDFIVDIDNIEEVTKLNLMPEIDNLVNNKSFLKDLGC